MPFLATVAGGEVPFDLSHRNGLRRPSRSRTPAGPRSPPRELRRRNERSSSTVSRIYRLHGSTFILDSVMWTQLAEAKQLNNLGPEASREPSEFFIERERRHAERLEKLTKLRAARLANATPKRRRHA